MEARANLEKKLASKKKEENEVSVKCHIHSQKVQTFRAMIRPLLRFQSKLRELAQKAREERAGLRTKSGKDDDEEVAERDDLRNARHKERARQRNIDRSA